MSSAHGSAILTRKTYRHLVYGLVGIGIAGLVAGAAVGQHLAGTVVYLVGVWSGTGVAVLAPRWSEEVLQDERDYRLHDRASGLTMLIVMGLAVGVIPAVFVLDAGGYVDPTGAMNGAVAFASALFVLYGIAYGIAKGRA